MQNQNQSGSTSVIVSVLMAILLIAAAAFGGWAFMSRQDYKDNSDKKSAVAVEAAEEVQKEALEKQFKEESKSPNKTYKGSATLGSIAFKYPKTWSAYVESTASAPLNGYFNPDVVPGIQSGAAFALRVEIVNTAYSEVLRSFDQSIKENKTRAKAYVPPKMKGVSNVQTGTRLDGVVGQMGAPTERRGAMVVIAVRDKTLKIYTESPTFLTDFNKIILPSLTFAP